MSPSRRGLLLLGLLAGAVIVWALARLSLPWTAPSHDELLPGAPRVKSLGADASHRYRVELRRGEYLHLIVEQEGVDAVVAVRSPAGDPVLEVDSPNGDRGPEPVFLVAREGGSHEVEVRSGPAVGEGTYRIRVETLRPATARDRDHAAAVLQFARGEELRRRGGAQELRRALVPYRQALAAWERMDEPRWQAAAWEKIGWVQHQLGELEEAAASLEAARQFLLASGEPSPALIRVILRSGWVRRDQGELPAALAAYEEALALARMAGNRRDESAAINNVALVHKARGELHEAAASLNQALLLARETGDVEGEALILGNLGELCSWIGLQSRARDLYTQALALNRERGAAEAAARNLAGLGRVERRTGELTAALERYREALRLFDQAESRRGRAEAQQGLGLALVAMGRYSEAQAAYREAEAGFRALGRNHQAAWVQLNVGWLFDAWGRRAEAHRAFSAALEELRSVEDRTGEASALYGLARTAARQGDLTHALTLMESAVTLAEELRDDALAASFRAAFLDTKYSYYLFLVDLLVARHQVEPEAGFDRRAFTAAEQARARATLDLLQAASSDRRVAAAAEGLEARRRELYEELEHLLQTRRHEAAGTRGRSAQAAPGLSTLLLERDVLQGEQQVELASPPVVDVAAARGMLARGTALLAYTLGDERSYLWWVTRQEMRIAILPPRSELEPRVHEVYEALRREHDPGEEARLRSHLARLSQILLGPIMDQLVGRRLIIVPDGALHLLPFSVLPVAGDEEGTGREVPLVAEHEVSRIPSLSVLAMIRERERRRRPPAGQLAIVADPVFGRWDPRLAGRLDAKPAGGNPESPAEAESGPGSRAFRAARDLGLDRLARLEGAGREGEALAALVPAARRFVAQGFAASRETVRSGVLDEYRIVHFATHGLLNTEHPELSGIVLSLRDPRGEPVDGFLPTYEIFDLDLPADLVVLSACRTGLGKRLRGEGLVGLPQSFLYAGASRVLVSLWAVEDEATATFMEAFYRALLEESLRPAAALRAAQLKLRRSERWQAPAYWAGFVLIGE